MAVLTGVITTDGHRALGKSWGFKGGYPHSHADYFRIGVGGYITTGGGRVPKTPDPALHDIEAATGALYYFQKTINAADIVFIEPSILQVRCRLESIDSNDDGSGESPKFFELGVYDPQGVLIGYSTFAEQTKAANKILTNYVQFYF